MLKYNITMTILEIIHEPSFSDTTKELTGS